MTIHNSSKRPIIALLIASIIWGATPAIMKLSLTSVPISSLGFLRFGAAAILLLPFVYQKLRVKRSDIITIILSGLLGITYNILFFFWGLTHTTAINAGLITATVPIFTLFFAQFFLGEKITNRLRFGVLLGFTGIACIIVKDILQQGISISPFEDFFLLISTVSFVLYEIVSKKLFKKYNPLVITFYMFSVGAISFLPATLFEYINFPSWISSLSTPAVFGVVFGILGSSILAYVLWNWGLSKMDVNRVGFFFYLNPIVSTITAVLLLSEKITVSFVLQSLFILIALFFSELPLPNHRLHKA